MASAGGASATVVRKLASPGVSGGTPRPNGMTPRLCASAGAGLAGGVGEGVGIGVGFGVGVGVTGPAVDGWIVKVPADVADAVVAAGQAGGREGVAADRARPRRGGGDVEGAVEVGGVFAEDEAGVADGEVRVGGAVGTGGVEGGDGERGGVDGEGAGGEGDGVVAAGQAAGGEGVAADGAGLRSRGW